MAERPLEYGSDLIVELLRTAGIEYVALNPGATFRGIHDSLVNYATDGRPEMILCNHEEIAVAIAHGYAKATRKPMAAMVHNVVGLQHASMAIYNAWCDRVPVLVLGGTGPMDTTQRRPRVDWIHTALVQGQQVRDYVKWDDQPASIAAVPDSFARAYRLATQAPAGPVYICYDTPVQEDRIPAGVTVPDLAKYLHAGRLGGDPAALDAAAVLLANARRPVVLAGIAAEDPDTFAALQELAETLGAPVVDLHQRLNFPSHHPLNLSAARAEVLPGADVILALGVPDLYGALHAGGRRREAVPRRLTSDDARIIHVSVLELATRSWAGDYQQVMATDLSITAEAAVAVPQLLARLRELAPASGGITDERTEWRRRWTERHAEIRQAAWNQAQQPLVDGRLAQAHVTATLWDLIRGQDFVLANGRAERVHSLWEFGRAGQHMGNSGGAGLGYGMGAAVGVALAYRDTNTLCINLQGDGDLMFTPGALWTAAHHRTPLLTVVLNNRSYYNDEEHQEAVARHRGRPPANKGVGIRIEDPDIHFARLAESLGVHGEGPVTSPEALRPALERALHVVRREGRPALVDVVVTPR